MANEKYTGVMVYGKALHREDGTRNTHAKDAPDVIRIEDAHPPIISRELFDRVQERMSGNKHDRGGRPATKRDYPLKGKVFCGECKAPMGINSSKHIYDYYKCSTAKRTHTCDLKPIRVDALERIVADVVRKILGQPSVVDSMIASMQREAAKVQTGAVNRLSVITEQYREVSAKLENAVEAVLGGLNSPTIQKRITELEQQKNALDREAQALRQSVDKTTIPADRLRQILNLILTDPTAGDAALLSIVARVEVSADQITVWTIFDQPTDAPIDYHQPGTPITDTTSNTPSETSPSAVITTLGVPSAPPTVIITPQFLRIVTSR